VAEVPRLLRGRGEVDPHRHHVPAAGGLGVPEPAGQGEHGPVLGQDLRGEVRNALVGGPPGQLAQQGGAQAAPLPGVDDGDGHLGLVRLPWVTDEPGHPHQLPGAGQHRDQSFVVAVIDCGEQGQGPPGQTGFGGEEPPVARGLAELPVRLGEAGRVIAAQCPDQHLVSRSNSDLVRDEGSVHAPSIAW
jgi:hypothetical protein